MSTQNITRVVGLDFARFIAIVGMMATHVWLYSNLVTGEKVWMSQQFEGRASALFAVLAGVGAVLSTRRVVAAGSFARARWMLVGRGLALVVIALTVGLLENPIVVILAYYGVMFWLLALVISWPRWALSVTAAALAVLTPVAAWGVGVLVGSKDPELGNPSWMSLADPLKLLRQLLFTGTYPAAIWVVYGIVGMLIGRAILAALETGSLRRMCLRLVAIGAALWLGGIGVGVLTQQVLGGIAAYARALNITPAQAQQLFDDASSGRPLPDTWLTLLGSGPHQGTTIDLLVTSGFAAVAIGVLLLLGSVLGPLARRLLTPVTAAGAAPLTVYTLHVLFVGVVTLLAQSAPGDTVSAADVLTLGTPWYLSSAGFLAANVLLALLVGSILASLGRRGPLETAVTWTGRTVGRLARHPAPGSPADTAAAVAAAADAGSPLPPFGPVSVAELPTETFAWPIGSSPRSTASSTSISTLASLPRPSTRPRKHF